MPHRTPPYRRPERPAAPRHECEADVLEGLEDFARDELSARFGNRVRFGADRPGALRFGFVGEPRELLVLRSVVAVYLVLEFDIPRPKALLGNQQFGMVAHAADLALGLAPGAYATLRLSAAGENSAVLTRFKQQLADRCGLAVAEAEGDLLLRLRRAEAGWELLVRLTPRPLATRAWRVCNLPGSLNATLAHAMAVLLEPARHESALNIACGSGTILIELLLLCQTKQAIGCDTDPAAIECARRNLAAAGLARAARLEPWDAGALPMADASVDIIAADLPFGQLVGSHRENQELYPRLVAEAARVARPGARMALLTHEVRLLEQVAARFAAQWGVREVLRVRSGGMAPRIVLLERLAS
ncbi:methyltransferase domain-containing protein [Kouleothrix sp.]|uniref:methyltransferase domain-containing protein n=1 Tax=Kouleothrix sp. TaxID=2779161 RepID=UPI00391CA447